MRLKRFRRRPALTDPTGHHLVSDAEHRHHVHAADHDLPQGAPNRGDEQVWVEAQTAQLADAGCLDEGTPYVLDNQITARQAQWDKAVQEEAERRRRTAKSLRAQEAEHLTALREQLARARTNRARIAHENSHWRRVLLGAPITSPADLGDTSVPPAVSHQVVVADTVQSLPAVPWARPQADTDPADRPTPLH